MQNIWLLTFMYMERPLVSFGLYRLSEIMSPYGLCRLKRLCFLRIARLFCIKQTNYRLQNIVYE